MPTITSVVPSSGTVGATITVNGTGFTGLTGVVLSGLSCAFTYISSTQFTFTVPAEGGGVKDLELLFGSTVSGAGTFTVDPGGTGGGGTSFGPEEVSFLEVVVYADDNSTELAQLEGAYSISLQSDLNTAGSGSFVIAQSDPKATDTVLAAGNLVNIRLNGQTIFSFWIEEPDEIVATPAGPQGEELTIAGRGGMSYMDRACVYPTSFPHPLATDIPYTAVPSASILYDQLVKAHARGSIPLLTWTFTATHDSAGNPWVDSVSESIHVGDDLLSLSQRIAQLHPIEYIFDHDNFVLHAYNPPFGVDRTKTVVWRQGRHFAYNPSRQSKHFSPAKSRMIVEGGFTLTGATVVEVVDATFEAETNIGRREGYLSYPNSTDLPTLSAVGLAALKNLEAQALPFQVSLSHGADDGSYEPFIDYNLGDFVTVDIPGRFDMVPYRIVTITLGFASVGAGDYTIQVDLTSPYIAPLLKVKQNILSVLNIANFGGGGSGGGGGGGGAVCCGGEILIAEAYTTSTLTLSSDGTVLSIPVTVDTPNTRIRVIAHAGIQPGTDAQPSDMQLVLAGPSATRYLPLGGTPVGLWNNGSWESPPLTIVAPGSYTVTLTVVNSAGTFALGYQVLVYLVTSGG